MHGKLISIDGIEGAGKSTQIALITDFLNKKGIAYHLTNEPGGTQLGQKIRQILLDNQTKITAKTEALLMFAARTEHVQTVIKPKLKKGIWVISDRFSDASYAYQGSGRALGFEAITTLEQWSIGNFKPDLSLFLDITLNISTQRVEQRGQKDRFECEQTDFFMRVRQGFLTLAKQNPERIVCVDASQSIEQVSKQIITHLQKKFNL